MFGENFEKFQDGEPAGHVNGTVQDVPTELQPVSSKDASAPTTSVTKSNVDKSKKSKINAKATGLTYQFQIVC